MLILLTVSVLVHHTGQTLGSEEPRFRSPELYQLFLCCFKPCQAILAVDRVFLTSRCLGVVLPPPVPSHTYEPTPLTERNRPAVPGFVRGCSNAPQNCSLEPFVGSLRLAGKHSCFLGPDFVGIIKGRREVAGLFAGFQDKKSRAA